MILSRRVALNGVELDEIHERIVIRSVDTGAPSESVTTVQRMGGTGQRITGQHWDVLDVTVSWAMDIPKTELAERRQVYEAVTKWALQKGWLTISYMENRRMYVDKVIMPPARDMRDWTEEYTLTFRAYNVPFWQAETPDKVTDRSVSSRRIWMDISGQFDSVLDVTFENISGMNIDNFSLWILNGAGIALTGIGLGGSETLRIHHGTDGLLRITAGGRSVLHCRTEGSSDDLYVSPGGIGFDVSAQRAGRLTVECFGRFA